MSAPRGKLIIAVVVLAVVIVALVAMLQWRIQNSVTLAKVTAREAHPEAGDDISALIAFIGSEERTLRERNRAVWALGRLRDAKAVPALQAAYTGRDCDHAHELCQQELAKAIRLCRGELPNRSGGS